MLGKGDAAGSECGARSCARAVERVDVRYGFLGSADCDCQLDLVTAGRAKMIVKR